MSQQAEVNATSRPLASVFAKKIGRQAFRDWQRELAPVYHVEIGQDTNFSLGGRTWQLPHGFIHEAWGSPISLTRDADLIRRVSFDQISIFCLIDGDVAADYSGQDVLISAGDMVFIDYALPSTSRSSSFRSYTITLPRDKVPMRGRNGSLHGKVVRANTPIGRLFSSHFSALVDGLGALEASQCETAFLAFVDLVVALWPPNKSPVAQSLLDRATATIRSNLRNPRLAPPALAQQLGVSRASLYAAFAPHGGISGLIQNMRLDESLKALVDEERRSGLVKAVAERYAFKSVAHFSRSFVARFGRTPTEVVTLSRERVGGLTFADWLKASGRDPSMEMIQTWLESPDAKERSS